MVADVHDRVSRGLGAAARALGLPTHAFRPRGAALPLAAANRYLRLPAVFHRDAGFRQPGAHGRPYWQGIFDSAYTKPGDYLVQGEDVYFIAAQAPLHPVLCVKVNRVLGFARNAAAAGVGMNPYSGAERVRQLPLLRGWPASVLGVARAPHPEAELPSDVPGGRLMVLLPVSAGVVLQAGDVMTDDLGRHGIVQAAELTELGWRLAVAEVLT